MNRNYSLKDYIPEELSIALPCGAKASFDFESGISYRCNDCSATVGSIGVPARCKVYFDMEDTVNKLKGNK